MCRQFEAVYLCHYGLWSLLENGIMNSKININSMGIPGFKMEVLYQKGYILGILGVYPLT